MIGEAGQPKFKAGVVFRIRLGGRGAALLEQRKLSGPFDMFSGSSLADPLGVTSAGSKAPGCGGRVSVGSSRSNARAGVPEHGSNWGLCLSVLFLSWPVRSPRSRSRGQRTPQRVSSAAPPLTGIAT